MPTNVSKVQAWTPALKTGERLNMSSKPVERNFGLPLFSAVLVRINVLRSFSCIGASKKLSLLDNCLYSDDKADVGQSILNV